MPRFCLPPELSSKSKCPVTDIVEHNATHNPEYPFYVFANDDADSGTTVITHTEFADAAHRAAYAIRPDPASPQEEVVAIISNSDSITYQAIVVGVRIAGLIPFPISPRNSPPAVVNLLEKTNCHRILTTKDTTLALMDSIRSHLSTHNPGFKVQINESPALLELFPQLDRNTTERPKPGIRYPKRADTPDPNVPYMFLHSSGSTGFPKPIPWSRRVLSMWTSMPTLRRYKSTSRLSTVACMPLPPFHAFGFMSQFLTPSLSGSVSAVYPPMVYQRGQSPMFPTPNSVLEHVRRTRANELVIIPSFLNVWLQSPEAVEQLKALDQVLYGGGALSQKTGDMLVEAGVRLDSLYGGTEFGGVTKLYTRSRDDKAWEYIEFDERVNVRYAPQGDGTYELQILKNEHYEPAVVNMPNGEGYATSDIIEEHPTRKGFWRVVGRIDDVIIHSSGEKTVPTPMESIINGNPMVDGVVLFGRERELVGALIELCPGFQIDVNNEAEVDDMRTRLWPTIEEANRDAPAFSRIYKEMIIFVPSDRPFPRTGKGTVMRKSALQIFDQEINDLHSVRYDRVENLKESQKVNPPQKVDPPASWDKLGLTNWFLHQLEDLHPDIHYDTSADLFDQGVDSLDVTFLRQRLLAILRQAEGDGFKRTIGKVKEGLIYSHPTVESLVSCLLALLKTQASGGAAAGMNDGRRAIEATLVKYSADLPPPPKSHEPLRGRATVLLTGSTGNLGSHLLAQLVEDDRVAKVYVLNRRSSGEVSGSERHERRFREHGLDVGVLRDGKVVYIESDTTKEKLGLGVGLYEELRNSINVIIHNAWRLDFNLSLPSYEPNIRGTRNLIDLALTGANNSSLRFMFTSSIASGQGWDKTKGPFPEESVEDASVAVGPGYGAAKYICERLLVKSSLQFCSLRIGQLTGAYPNGAWATTDWVPILVKSSIHLGALPLCPGLISWLPMNAVAAGIRDIVFSKGEPPKAINVVHPYPIKWNDAIWFINDALVEQGIIKEHLRTIAFPHWVNRLEERAISATDEVFESVPAIKLKDFYKSFADTKYAYPDKEESGGFATFETKKAQAASPAINDLKRLEREDAERWINYWKEVGYFH
ncbi:hypothetical protein AX16_005765 [Volvariella volvacea WC 439]|nr:hypothetical protein AX16_005765 [Volvariella volvacea WC 439]